MRAREAESIKALLIAVMVTAAVLPLASCQPVQKTAPAGSAAPAPAPAAVPGAQRYVVSGEDSLVLVVARRGGALASLGHNHVMASHSLAGEIDLAPSRERTRFELRMPVEGLTVDEPALRAGRGEDFPPEVPQDAREGTRANLLGPAVLDGEHHPLVVVRSTEIRREGEDWRVTLAITVRNHTSGIEVPVEFEESDGTLRIRSRFEVAQSALGLEPFSALLGALKVEDQLSVEVQLVARAAH